MLTWFRNQTLVFRLLFLTLSVSFAATLINTLAHEWFYGKKQSAQTRIHVEESIKLYFPKLISAYENNDLETQKQILSTISSLSMVHNASLLPAEHLKTDTDQLNKGASFNKNNQLLITLDTSKGKVSIDINILNSFRNIGFQELTLFELFTSLIQVSILGVFIVFFIQKLIVRHLRNIADFSEHLSVNNLGQTLRLNRSEKRTNSDELDLVVEALETMRLQLIEDIDNRKSMEIALLREKEENLETKKLVEDTKASDQAKSQFIATMSHEIRTPMNGIIGMVQMLQGTSIDEEQKNYLNIISRSSNALMHIINDILDFSKIEAGKLNLDIEQFHLDQHVSDCVQLFIGVANARNIDLISNIDPDVPNHIYSDSKRLLQVLTNLIGNAFKFTENGSVAVNVQAISNDRESCWLRFSVKDTGIGIDKSQQKTIFHAYKQADDSMTRKYGGTGLGLSICKHIVEMMEGEIGLKSEPNQGSEFWFTAKFEINNSDQTFISAPSTVQVHSLLYIDPFADTAHNLEKHASLTNIPINAELSIPSAIKLLKSSESKFDACIVNSIHSKPELEQLTSAIESHPQLRLYIFSSGNSFKQLAKVDTLKPYLHQRPIFVKQFLHFLTDRNATLNLSNDASNAQQKTRTLDHLSVLVAEDNAVNRIVIEGLLKKLQIQPQFANNGEEAVNIICQSENPFDIVFMDCEMPVMDGFSATLKIREWESENAKKSTPIIALTAHVESSYKQRCFDSGMDMYLCKPITVEKLDEAMKDLTTV